MQQFGPMFRGFGALGAGKSAVVALAPYPARTNKTLDLRLLVEPVRALQPAFARGEAVDAILRHAWPGGG